MSPVVAFSHVSYHSGRDAGMNAAFINLLNDAPGAFNTCVVTIAKNGGISNRV